jgi:hypothetical protein
VSSGTVESKKRAEDEAVLNKVLKISNKSPFKNTFIDLIWLHLAYHLFCPNWQVPNGLCSAFGNWKMQKWRRFLNTITPWPMLVRQYLRNLQKWGAFIVAFTSKI